jgi:hypothetical protein
MSGILVNIERLVLSGDRVQPDGGGERFARETEGALQQLFEQRGLPPGLVGGDVLEVLAPEINRPSSAVGEPTGRELALAIYLALDRNEVKP